MGNSDATNLAIQDELFRSDSRIKVMPESAKADLEDGLDGGQVVEDQAGNDEPVVERGFHAL